MYCRRTDITSWWGRKGVWSPRDALWVLDGHLLLRSLVLLVLDQQAFLEHCMSMPRIDGWFLPFFWSYIVWPLYTNPWHLQVHWTSWHLLITTLKDVKIVPDQLSQLDKEFNGIGCVAEHGGPAPVSPVPPVSFYWSLVRVPLNPWPSSSLYWGKRG